MKPKENLLILYTYIKLLTSKLKLHKIYTFDLSLLLLIVDIF